jgi:GAF domain-containing protein
LSEELENSLQQAIESYLGKRLAAIDEQLNRLQSDFDQALGRVRESSAGASLEASPLSAAIFAHLQTARAQKLSGSTPDPAHASSDISNIKRAVEDIDRQHTHTDILSSLLTSAVQFAERGALFVVRNDQAIGWRECEASDPTNVELIGGVSLPLSADTLLGRVAHSRSAWSGAPGANPEDSLVIDQLGGNPQTVAAVPLVARGKVVAILYADSASGENNAVNVDALELLTRVAAMAVNLAAAPRPVPEKQAVAEPVTQAAEFQPESSRMPVEASSEAAEPTHEDQRTYTPEIEPQVSEVVAPPFVEEISVTAEPELAAEAPQPAVDQVPVTAEGQIVHEETAAPVEEVSAKEEAESVSEAQPEPASEPFAAAPAIEPTSEAPATAPAAPSFASQYAAPLGSSTRRYGVSEPDLPIEVGEDERRLHNDARRFARLLVSEIKLYNEPKVKEGRNRSDIYDRLRDDIDRSRQMYDKRVAPPVAARHDYFHQELVNTLAEGDPAKLGDSYPGAVLVAN